MFKTWLQQPKGGLPGRGLFCWPIVLLATVTGGSCHNHHFCRYKSFWHDKTFVATYFCHNKTFYRDKKYVCYNKHVFVMTKYVICSDKSMLVATTFVTTKIFCCNKTFVAASILLSQQRHVCHDKTFVMTKMVFVTAPANDK